MLLSHRLLATILFPALLTPPQHTPRKQTTSLFNAPSISATASTPATGSRNQATTPSNACAPSPPPTTFASSTIWDSTTSE